MKGFNKIMFARSLVIMGPLFILAFLADWASREETGGNGLIGALISKLLFLTRFPCKTFFSNYFSRSGLLVLLGFGFNILIWGLIIERCSYYFKIFSARRKYNRGLN